MKWTSQTCQLTPDSTLSQSRHHHRNRAGLCTRRHNERGVRTNHRTTAGLRTKRALCLTQRNNVQVSHEEQSVTRTRGTLTR